MNLYQLTEVQLIVFALVLLRVIAFCFSAAILSATYINVPTRILVSLALTMCMYSTVKVGSIESVVSSEALIFSAAIEILYGLLLGFMTRLFFFVVGMFGEICSISMGLNSAQLFNPMSGSSGGVLEQFYVILGSIFFLALNGHHMLLIALSHSFELLPLGSTALKTGGLGEAVYWAREVLAMALKMSAPVLVAILLANVVMGILGRAIPQMNVLVTSMPVTLLLGFGVMFVCMPLLVFEMNGIIGETATKLMQVMKSL